MTSKDTDALIILIYRYLKDNGYKKVATALRKHAPQVETEEVKVSLSEIFKSWSRKQKRHEKAGNHLTGAQKSDASESSDDPSEPPDVQTPELSPAIVNAQSPKKPVKTNIRKTSASKKQIKKETVTKSRKRKSSVSITPENDSDSDSSLDVDKWTKLLTQLSDSDIAKMEVLSNFVETPVSTPVTSAGKGRKTKQTKPKKETNSAKNEKSKAAAKKTKSKTDHIPVRTDTAKTAKKSTDISEGGKTPYKKARGHCETSDLNVAETPKTTKVQKHKPSENQTNGLMKTNRTATPSKGTKAVGLSDSENVKTPKKVKVKSSHDLSEQVENHAKAVAENDSETSSSQTLSKKAQKKVEMLSESTNFKTPSGQPDNSLSATKVKKKKNASKLAEADCNDTDLNIDNTHLMSDQSETPSKKVKNKKLESVVELAPSETPKKHKSRKSDCPIDLDMANTPDVLQESSNIELHERLSEEAETPSKKSKKAKGRKSQAQIGDDNDNCGDGLDNEDTSDQDFKKHSKKRKHKREEVNDDLAQEEATPEPKKAKKEKWKNEDVENMIEDDQQPSVEEPVEISQKKKKKKKDKERESDNTVSDDHPVSTATEEVIVHKKKKKRKEKHFSRDEAPGLDDTQR